MHSLYRVNSSSSSSMYCMQYGRALIHRTSPAQGIIKQRKTREQRVSEFQCQRLRQWMFRSISILRLFLPFVLWGWGGGLAGFKLARWRPKRIWRLGQLFGESWKILTEHLDPAPPSPSQKTGHGKQKKYILCFHKSLLGYNLNIKIWYISHPCIVCFIKFTEVPRQILTK